MRSTASTRDHARRARLATIGLVLAGLAGGACRERTPTPTAGSAASAPRAVTPSVAPVAEHARAALPTLPAAPLDAAAPSAPPAIADEFEAEPIDRFWRTNTEAAIRRHVTHLTDVECHHTLCRITATGPEAEIERAFDGMRDVTSSLLFTAPELHPDGTVALRAYARFTRDEH